MASQEAQIIAIEARVMAYLHRATDLKLNLDEDESAYHRGYVAKKITQCGVVMEKLSDMQMELTKIALEVTKQTQDARYLLKTDVAIYQSSTEYKELPSNERAAWLQAKTRELDKQVALLSHLLQVVAEVRQAIGDRIGTFKRLDSDVRLHQKLLESMGSTAGATSPQAYVGSRDSDIDI